ncbi:UNVERIFIED_ORG: hypothetical protein J2Y81_002148 [Paraburkholderia sediminicola]|uniref:DUF2513 domain-containing protein n=1 Tax=Paraburkholderia aspalathi TaxID=1324617 RepID=UPI002112183A|nr:hypothetical protein [Paraburkholderia sediminicola]
MKLDKDLVREILLALEASDHNPLGWVTLKIPERSPKEIAYHVMLLDEAGLIVGQDLCSMGPDGFDWAPRRLTYSGHEFLDTVRDGEVWRRVKAGAEQAGAASITLLMGLGKAYAKQMIKERLGVDLG